MIAVESIRGALRSDDPAGELDRLVRDQLASGKTTSEVYSALLPVVRSIRRATPLAEDLDEILLGTLDALTGSCNPDEWYRDPPDRSPAPAK